MFSRPVELVGEDGELLVRRFDKLERYAVCQTLYTVHDIGCACRRRDEFRTGSIAHYSAWLQPCNPARHTGRSTGPAGETYLSPRVLSLSGDQAGKPDFRGVGMGSGQLLRLQADKSTHAGVG